MTIDWHSFTPWTSLAGGLLIGLASALLILANGRIAGISGILGGLLERRKAETPWLVAFIGGLFFSPWLCLSIAPGRPVTGLLTPATPGQWATLALAGLLVGFGTRLARGCTSGHGVCGLSRLSPRSLAAVATFMMAAMLTVYINHHLIAN